MTYDPLGSVIDAPLSVSDEVMRALTEFRGAEKFLELADEEEPDVERHRQRLITIFNEALDKVIAGLRSNPRKQWRSVLLNGTWALANGCQLHSRMERS